MHFCRETRFYEDSETVSVRLYGKGALESMSLRGEDGKAMGTDCCKGGAEDSSWVIAVGQILTFYQHQNTNVKKSKNVTFLFRGLLWS